MNSWELKQCRREQKHREMMKDPVYKAAYEAGKRRANEQKHLEEVMKMYEPGYVPLLPEMKREKTAEEARMESVLKNYM